MTDTTTLKIRLCIAALFAEVLSSAPIYLDIREFPPAPNPFPNPTIIINNGVIYPSAANGSAPSPATQILSIILFAKIKNILAIIGNDNLLIAFLGSPVIISMFSFFSITYLILAYAIILLYMQVLVFKVNGRISKKDKKSRKGSYSKLPLTTFGLLFSI